MRWTCMVLPRPMSFPRIPPLPLLWTRSKKSFFLRTYRLVSLKPAFLTTWFFRPPLNHLKFRKHDLLDKHRLIVKFLHFLDFFIFIMPCFSKAERKEDAPRFDTFKDEKCIPLSWLVDRFSVWLALFTFRYINIFSSSSFYNCSAQVKFMPDDAKEETTGRRPPPWWLL